VFRGRNIAVGDRMFLGMQDFNRKILILILPNSNQNCPNLTKFDKIKNLLEDAACIRLHSQLLRHWVEMLLETK